MIERHPIVDRAEWLEWRKQDVTASRVGALFGAHPYETALRLYAERRGVEFPSVDSKTMRRGRWLEPAVATAVEEERPDWKLRAPKVYLRDPELRLGATPDFYIDGDPRGLGILQCKTVAPSVYQRNWLGGSEIPFWITLQTLTEMMLADAAFGVVAALLVDPHSMEVAILDVPRHPPSEEKIRERVREFWQNVANGIEPDPDFSRDADVIRALVPRETLGEKIDLSSNNRLPTMLEQRAALKETMKEADVACEAIETEIKFLMGSAETANGLPDWRITFKTEHRKEYTVKARSSRVLRIHDKRPEAS
jgi:predicted phage-related endonuclease